MQYLGSKGLEHGAEADPAILVLRGKVGAPCHWHQVRGQENTHGPASTTTGGLGCACSEGWGRCDIGKTSRDVTLVMYGDVTFIFSLGDVTLGNDWNNSDCYIYATKSSVQVLKI